MVHANSPIDFWIVKVLKSLNLDDFILDGYDPHPAIKAKMAI